MSGWVLNAADVGPLGVVLIAIVATVGALLIHAFSRRRGRSAAASASAPEPAEDAGLRAQLIAIAERMELPPSALPAARPPHGDGSFLWRAGGVLHYAAFEHGVPFTQEKGPPDDAVLYALFRDCAWGQAYVATIGMEEIARSEEIAARQYAMLTAADPAWGTRFTAERAGTE